MWINLSFSDNSHSNIYPFPSLFHCNRKGRVSRNWFILFHDFLGCNPLTMSWEGVLLLVVWPFGRHLNASLWLRCVSIVTWLPEREPIWFNQPRILPGGSTRYSLFFHLIIAFHHFHSYLVSTRLVEWFKVILHSPPLHVIEMTSPQGYDQRVMPT